jgi:hypothetical protein
MLVPIHIAGWKTPNRETLQPESMPNAMLKKMRGSICTPARTGVDPWTCERSGEAKTRQDANVSCPWLLLNTYDLIVDSDEIQNRIIAGAAGKVDEAHRGDAAVAHQPQRNRRPFAEESLKDEEGRRDGKEANQQSDHARRRPRPHDTTLL